MKLQLQRTWNRIANILICSGWCSRIIPSSHSWLPFMGRGVSGLRDVAQVQEGVLGVFDESHIVSSGSVSAQRQTDGTAAPEAEFRDGGRHARNER